MLLYLFKQLVIESYFYLDSLKQQQETFHRR